MTATLSQCARATSRRSAFTPSCRATAGCTKSSCVSPRRCRREDPRRGPAGPVADRGAAPLHRLEPQGGAGPGRAALLPVFRMRGFRQYATEQILFAEQVHRGITPSPEGARPLKRGDTRRLYQLYRKVTPQHVSQLEAPTYRDWRALHGEWTGRLGTGGSNKEDLVGDPAQLVGWGRAHRSSVAHPP